MSNISIRVHDHGTPDKDFFEVEGYLSCKANQCSTCLGILQLSSLTSFLHVLRHLKMNWMKDLHHTPHQSKLIDTLRWHGSAAQVDCEGRAMDTDTGSCESLTNDAVRCQACRGTCGRKGWFFRPRSVMPGDALPGEMTHRWVHHQNAFGQYC